MTSARVFRLLPVLCLVLVWAFLLRPQFLGGPAAYIMVVGKSMEPTLYTGDLVVARQHDSYELGDIIAFAASDSVVIHRIVEGDAEEGFIMQGDNVDNVDSWRPRPENIAGKMWFRVPHLGSVFSIIRRPHCLPAASAGLVTLALLWRKRPSHREASKAKLKRRKFRHARIPCALVLFQNAVGCIRGERT